MSEVQINSAPNAESPELILGKFRTTDDLAAAYKQLESKLGSNYAQTPEEVAAPVSEPEATPTTTEPTEAVEAVYGEALVNAVAAAGLDINKVAEEWATEEGVSEQTREALNKTFGVQVVDAYFRGLEAQKSGVTAEAEKAMQGIVESVGGEAAWTTIAEWAAGVNGPPLLVEAYNGALDRGDTTTMQALAVALKGSYEANNGSIQTTSVTQGQAAGVAGAAGFRSQQELISAMSDPRYAKDAAYREDVAQRMKQTKGFTVS